MIELEVSPKKPVNFSLALRIPAWVALDRCSVEVNGEAQSITMHGWHTISRTWQSGDKVTLKLDMRGRVLRQDNYQALMRGPVVLARDSRFGDGDVDESSTIVQEGGYVELTPVQKPDFAWMAYSALMVLGADMEGHGEQLPVRLCDFGSAGNTWEKSTRYRVWLPETLNAMYAPYVPYNKAP